MRKRVAADAQTGLLIECLLLAVPGLAYVAVAAAGRRRATRGRAPAAAWLLIACGPITAVPLVLFSWAARRMPLSAMGFLQFLAPTIGFVIGRGAGRGLHPAAGALLRVHLGRGGGLRLRRLAARPRRSSRPPTESRRRSDRAVR